MPVEVRDLGIGRLKRELAKLAKSRVTLGYQGRSGRAQHPGADASVADVAAWHEYGTDQVPARPFQRTAMDRKGGELSRQIKRSTADLIDGRARSADELLEKIGEAGVKAIRETIDDADSWAAPLAESTVAKKGHDQPLLDTGTLRDSASWAIRRGDLIVKQGGEE